MLKLLIFILVFLQTISAYGETKPEIINLNIKNTVFLSDNIGPIVVDNVLFSLFAKRTTTPIDSPIYLILDTDGGALNSAYLLVKSAEHIPLITVFCKYCASAGGYIFEILSPKSRLVTIKSSMMMHHASFGFTTATTPTYVADFIDESDRFDQVFYTRIGITKSAYEDKIRLKTYELKGKEILNNHLADRLVTIECDPYIAMLDPVLCEVK